MLRLLILLSVLLVPLAAPAEAPVVLCPDASPEAFPTPLARVRLSGLPVEDEDFLTALRAHFTLLPGFDRVERVDDFFLSAWATGCSAAGGYDPRLRYEPSVSFPIRDPLLKRLWDECAAFLGALPMWMPNWANECLPGWCVRLELYNREQGTFVAALDTCVDAVTGRVAQPGTD